MYDGALTAQLSVDRLVAELPFLLLVLAMLWSGASRIRAAVAVAALAGLAHALLVAEAPLAAFWWGLLLAVTVALLVRRLLLDRGARFTPDEEAMVAAVLPGLAPARARHLLDHGFWLSGDRGDVLTREDEPVGHLYYLAAGEARVLSHGRQVGTCRAGDLIGEVTVLSGEQASATVILTGPARFWCAPASVLRPYLAAHEEVRHALEQGFAIALKSKLRATNRTIAEAEAGSS
ncbi:MAG TPA: cyclic nucleotide-binding domain-containing protein [Allosphingosinicella sp.]|nr:cyclic nucleotide-binding domain-containing protein [Allosphingosinicella sp.]